MRTKEQIMDMIENCETEVRIKRIEVKKLDIMIIRLRFDLEELRK